ncbi:MAG: hypothetical protein LEGION0403_FIIPPAGN_02766 [Legionella sp.]|uniref:lytic transglycosylase domain-containing protein n=1 Tax=Legionella sp. TaxID=459 RepID=UPI003D0AD25C
MGSKPGKEFGEKLESLDNHSGMLRAELQTLAGAGAQSLTTDTHFDALQVLGGNLGSTIGNAVVGRFAWPGLEDRVKDIAKENIKGLVIDDLLTDWENYKKLNNWDDTIEGFKRDLAQPIATPFYEYSSIPDPDQYSAIPGSDRSCAIPENESHEFSSLTKSESEKRLNRKNDVNHNNVLKMTPKQIWKVRAYKGTPIPEQKIGKVDAIRKLVGYKAESLSLVSRKEIGLNLDRLQDQVLAAHEAYPEASVDLINAMIVVESKGVWNAVSPTGVLGVMQMTSDNYLKDGNFNPFDTGKSIMYAAKMASSFINKYGGTEEGIKKVLVSYNQGSGHVRNGIELYGDGWLNNIKLEGKNYIVSIDNILKNSRKIPGYFGEKR